MLAFNAPAVPEKTAEVLAALGLPAASRAATRCCRLRREFCAELGIVMSPEGRRRDRQTTSAAWAEEAHGIRRLMDNNPRDMSVEDVEAIYRAAL